MSPGELIQQVASIRGNQYSDRADHRMFKLYAALSLDDKKNMPSMLYNLIGAYFANLLKT